jgi:hypothetical protein
VSGFCCVLCALTSGSREYDFEHFFDAIRSSVSPPGAFWWSAGLGKVLRGPRQGDHLFRARIGSICVVR